MPSRNVQLLFALFALSGFTGLIYESVWSHYLKLFLGAAAFTQSFVLVAFMGGMALGAWFVSRASSRLDLYAAIAARDAQAMLGLARALLGSGLAVGEEGWGRYLLLTAMLGAHATGEREEVQRLWQTYGSALYPDGKVPPAEFYMVKWK